MKKKVYLLGCLLAIVIISIVFIESCKNNTNPTDSTVDPGTTLIATPPEFNAEELWLGSIANKNIMATGTDRTIYKVLSNGDIEVEPPSSIYKIYFYETLNGTNTIYYDGVDYSQVLPERPSVVIKMYKILSTQIDENGNTNLVKLNLNTEFNTKFNIWWGNFSTNTNYSDPNYGQDAPIPTEIDIDFNQTPNIIGRLES